MPAKLCVYPLFGGLTAYGSRLRARIGPAQAQVATAHKIAWVVYHMLKFKMEYQAMSAGEYEQRFREREIKHLQRKAACLGFALSPVTTTSQAVS